MKPTTFLICFGALFLISGIGAGIFGYFYLEEAKASIDWPTTEGTIEVSKIKSWEKIKVTKKNRRPTIMYQASVTYEYTVDGNKLVSDRITYGSTPSSSTKSTHEKTISKYPMGSKVKVFYNPENPETAILEPGAGFTAYVPLVVGGAFIIVGLGMIVFPGFFRLKGNKNHLATGVDINLS